MSGFSFFDKNIIDALGMSLLHSIWQGTALFLILYLGLKTILKRTGSNTKYLVSLFTLVILFTASAVTFEIYHTSYQNKYSSTIKTVTEYSGGETVAQVSSSLNKKSYFDTIERFLNKNSTIVVNLWIIGVVIFSLKVGLGFAYLKKLQKSGFIVKSEVWNEMLDNIIKKSGIRRHVKFIKSFIVNVPITFGVLKPVIMVPAEYFTNIPKEQLEAIIAHEIAHIKRYDYLINILQNVIEILYFFHPGVHWISRVIRNERENCCDDFAVKIFDDRVNFAKALYNVSSFAQKSSMNLVMAANGGSYPVLERIKRITGKEKSMSRFKEKFTASIIVITGLLFIFTAGFLGNTVYAESTEKKDGKILIKTDFDDNKSTREVSVTVFDEKDEDIEKEREFKDTIIQEGKNGEKIKIKINKKSTSISQESDGKKSKMDYEVDLDVDKLIVNGKEVSPYRIKEYVDLNILPVKILEKEIIMRGDDDKITKFEVGDEQISIKADGKNIIFKMDSLTVYPESLSENGKASSAVSVSVSTSGSSNSSASASAKAITISNGKNVYVIDSAENVREAAIKTTREAVKRIEEALKANEKGLKELDKKLKVINAGKIKLLEIKDKQNIKDLEIRLEKLGEMADKYGEDLSKELGEHFKNFDITFENLDKEFNKIEIVMDEKFDKAIDRIVNEIDNELDKLDDLDELDKLDIEIEIEDREESDTPDIESEPEDAFRK